MRVVLTVESGTHAGKSITLEPGQKALVGKASWAELCLDDPQLAGRHFSVECDGHRCKLVDMKSAKGTFVNGGRVAEAVLQHGDRILAGQTTLVVSFAGAPVEPPPKPAAPVQTTPAPREPVPPVAKPTASTGKLELRQVLRAKSQPLYALLDAARDERVLELLKPSKQNFQSLYEGEEGDLLADFAPYLVRMSVEGPEFLETLIKEGWGNSWGVYLHSTQSFAEVRKHFRRFLTVKMPNGTEALFRFYDPRVMRPFLTNCTPDEAKQFFGPVSSYLIEAEDPAILLDCTLGKHGVKQDLVLLFVP